MPLATSYNIIAKKKSQIIMNNSSASNNSINFASGGPSMARMISFESEVDIRLL